MTRKIVPAALSITTGGWRKLSGGAPDHADRELTELAREAEMAEAANDRISRLLEDASHAIRSPLHCIIGYSEMMMEEVSPTFDAQQLDDVRRIGEACQTLLGIVSGVFDLSQIEAATANSPHEIAHKSSLSCLP